MKRVYNFCSGPAMIPVSVLEKAQKELLNWGNVGASIMELSHRSAEFEGVMDACEQRLRTLLNIPSNYKVLFFQGGAYAQFSIVPLNLLGDQSSIDFIDTGIWSSKAIACAVPYAKTNIIATTKESNYCTLPDQNSFVINQESAYLHLCDNESINGIEFNYPIDSPIPIVADMSSNILSKEIAVSDYGLIYAGAQKNMGTAGVTLVIVREDLIGKARKDTPQLFDYAVQATNSSMLNTPPTFSIYIMGLVLEWLEAQGGVAAIEKVNKGKAALLYKTIDESGFYSNPIEKTARSRMNIPFILKNTTLEKAFLAEAQKADLINLAGHRSVGGMRASIYNAMPLEGVIALCDFMVDFEKRYG